MIKGLKAIVKDQTNDMEDLRKCEKELRKIAKINEEAFLKTIHSIQINFNVLERIENIGRTTILVNRELTYAITAHLMLHKMFERLIIWSKITETDCKNYEEVGQLSASTPVTRQFNQLRLESIHSRELIASLVLKNKEMYHILHKGYTISQKFVKFEDGQLKLDETIATNGSNVLSQLNEVIKDDSLAIVNTMKKLTTASFIIIN